MAAARLIRLKAAVKAVRSEKLAMVQLANGHQVAAFAGRSAASRLKQLRSGDSVLVEMSPCDMSCGRLRFE